MDSNALSKARLEQACECLELSQLALDNNFYKGSATHSYYAIFHAMRAVLAIDGFDSKKHSGIISRFNFNHVRTGNFDKRFSKMVEKAFTTRNSSDYEDFYVISKAKVAEQLTNAREFVAAVADYLAKLP
ncbi:MAG: HEPN domain-containing protein [Turicibacter sp.]|nr:HEPN domain-containing protein [Turicibacter sp.]